MFFVNPFLVLYQLGSYNMIIVLADNMNIINIVKLVIVMPQEHLLLREKKLCYHWHKAISIINVNQIYHKK